jgi:hypothetical protein
MYDGLTEAIRSTDMRTGVISSQEAVEPASKRSETIRRSKWCRTMVMKLLASLVDFMFLRLMLMPTGKYQIQHRCCCGWPGEMDSGATPGHRISGMVKISAVLRHCRFESRRGSSGPRHGGRESPSAAPDSRVLFIVCVR